jgi:hypothetical protein
MVARLLCSVWTVKGLHDQLYQRQWTWSRSVQRILVASSFWTTHPDPRAGQHSGEQQNNFRTSLLIVLSGTDDLAAFTQRLNIEEVTAFRNK